MSGDVQPRKRKDKKRKKDELGVEEPRGTAAALGEGDVFMHSQHDHGTGGHWCAKIIFFSLLAVLVTLIGLIILENRGLTELEANSVESRYSGVLEGWLEDAPDDDHHDEHTLELNHHDEDEHEEEEQDSEIEIEKIEQEASDEEPISTELPALPEEEDDDSQEQEVSKEIDDDDDDDGPEDEGDVEDEEFLEPADDDGDDSVEPITAPAGKPFVEVEEEDTSSERPPDSLAEEEEYEKQQEELRREEEEASHVWLKVSVGGALLAATHVLVGRALRPREQEPEEAPSREETPSLIDRRMTLIAEPPPPAPVVKTVAPETSAPRIQEEIIKTIPEIIKSSPTPKQTSEEEEEEIEEVEDVEEIEEEEAEEIEAPKGAEDKELYSDEEVEEEEEEEVVEAKKDIPVQSTPEPKPESPEPEDDDAVPDDVEIIDDEQLEEELEEEEEEEDDISDVDDVELLSRLEAKYGRLPEPERPGQKFGKDGGNSVEDDWPGEPSDAYWRQQLDHAEQDLQQEWLD